MAEDPTPEEARRTIRKLIRENRTLSEALDGLRAQSTALEKATRQALRGRQKAEKEAEEARLATSELRREVGVMKSTNRRLEAQVARLSNQVESTALHALTPEEASALLGRTLQALSEYGTFQVRDATLTLKLATGKLGDEPVLVFPEPGSVDPASLHELKLTLRGSGVSPETT